MTTMKTTHKRKTVALLIGALFSYGAIAVGLDDSGLNLRGNGSVDDSQPGMVSSSNDIVNGVKLRGDGSVDDSQPGMVSTSNDIVNGVKLRGDGTVDDSQPGMVSTSNDIVNGVKLRGDGSVDDSQPGARVQQTRTTASVNNPDGTTTVTGSKVTTRDGGMVRTKTETTTFDQDGRVVNRTRSDLRLNAAGEVVRDRQRERSAEGNHRTERVSIEKAEKAERPEKVEKVEKAERPEKVEKVEKIERPEKVEKVEKIERPEKVEKVEKIERPEKVEKSGRG